MNARIPMILFICLITASCSNIKKTGNSDDTPDIIKRIAELPEYKKAESKVDSLKKNGMNVDIQIVILPDEVRPSDSLSVAYIEANYGFDEDELFEIKFEKKSQRIVFVNPVNAILEPRRNLKIEKVK
jgi:hypothetical protein